MKAIFRRLSCAALSVWIGVDTTTLTAAQSPDSTNYVRGTLVELNDNGGWSWFMDERTIVDRGRLIAGSVRAVGTFRDSNLPEWGNVELSILEFKSGKVQRITLHEHLEQDDHDSPGLLVLPDGRYLAAYSKHRQEPRLWFRISTRPGDPFSWQPEVEFVTPSFQGMGPTNNVTYCNPIMLSKEHDRIYLFHRGVSQDPNYLLSEDGGRSWRYGGKLFDGLHGYSPYTKYASNGKDSIHFVGTEDHPRHFDNSIYYGLIRKGQVYRSDGTVAGALSDTTNTTIHPWDLTRIYEGGRGKAAWMSDIELDEKGRPGVLFTVHTDFPRRARGQGGEDHRFHYARWDGSGWHESEIAYAGKRLYAGEDDYTGLGSIDPQNANVLYISTDADPRTGAPLISKADGLRHHELYRGTTANGGLAWTWMPVTANSTMDNLRPIVPHWKDARTALVWMRGTYLANHGEWTTKVVVCILRREDFAGRKEPVPSVL